MKIALRVNPLIYKGFKVVVIYNFEINLSSVAVINKGLETPCEKNCPFPQRTPTMKTAKEGLILN
jgi:hypothetical protein